MLRRGAVVIAVGCGLLLSALLLHGNRGDEEPYDLYEYVPGDPPPVAPLAEIPSGRPSGGSVYRFAVLGDTRLAVTETYDMAEMLAQIAEQEGLDAVLSVGDNLNNDELTPRDLYRRFRRPFRPLLDLQVPFFTSLGNHDIADGDASFMASLPDFHMEGHRYSARHLSDHIDAFFIDSATLKQEPQGPEQLHWLAGALASSEAEAKIAVLHHPLYGPTSERPEPSGQRRESLEPLFIEHGVQIVFQGHNHIYQRMTPQRGVHYFTVGAGSMTDPGESLREPAVAFDDDSHVLCMVWEIDAHQARFQTLASDGSVLDEGQVVLEEAGQ